MKSQDLITAHGEVHLEIRDKDGRVLEQFNQKNLIVNGGRDALIRLLGDGTAGKRINQIGFGTGSAAAALTDTALAAGAFVKAVGSVSYIATNQARFNWTLNSTEGNGLAIRELGLITVDGTLFSRLVRDLPINKTSDIVLYGQWLLTF